MNFSEKFWFTLGIRFTIHNWTGRKKYFQKLLYQFIIQVLFRQIFRTIAIYYQSIVKFLLFRGFKGWRNCSIGKRIFLVMIISSNNRLAMKFSSLNIQVKKKKKRRVIKSALLHNFREINIYATWRELRKGMENFAREIIDKNAREVGKT